MFTGGGTLQPVDRRPPKFGPWPRDEDYWHIRCYRPTKPIPDEVHREQLQQIGRKLDELCRHMNVQQNSEHQRPKAEWCGRVNSDPVTLPIMPPKATEGESSQDGMASWASKENEGVRRLAEFIKKSGLTEALLKSRKQPAIEVVSGETVHSPLVMAEIKCTLIKVNLSQGQEVAWFEDQHGITWGISFLLDAEVLIMQIHTTKCPEIFGNFRIMLKFIHESPFKSFPQSLQMTVRDSLSAYTTPIANIMQMVQDGYMTRDGEGFIRVSIVSTDGITDQCCARWTEQNKTKAPQQSVPKGGRKQQQKQQSKKAPQFCSARFSVTNYTITPSKTSPKLLDSKRGTWHLVVSMNRTSDSLLHQDYISVFIKRFDSADLYGCYEYFVELCPAHGPDGKRQAGHRRSGRLTTGSELLKNFIAKCQLEPYLKDNTLRFWWGIREVPIREVTLR